MGKSWKENKSKYRNDRDFQKKHKQKSGHNSSNQPKEDEFGGVPVKDWEAWQNT